ncbi:MAG TPA: ATP-binding cassette domain-containing protein [Verrucomicrobiae bacterium]|jgi:phospholipid/cholesterol/gamma-HCH transport system ATP-binding protein
MKSDHIKIEIQDLTMAYGSRIVMSGITAKVYEGSVFVIMGNSGSGKSTLLRHLIGLQRPAQGDVLYDGKSFWAMDDASRKIQLRKYGVLFQSGALWSSMTLAENIALPLIEYTDWSAADRDDIVRLKLALVGLSGFEDYYPAEISGGMRKRAGLARAMALDPEILFFDEPSAGLDPITSRNLDKLILELRDSLGATIVVVTHELASIFLIADDSIFLDADTKTMRVQGNPKDLLNHSTDAKLKAFLTRGASLESTATL